jgi:hypothetical protein
MSLLISQVAPNGVLTLSDTLGTVVGGPRLNQVGTFGVKVHPVPHLEALVGGVGADAVMQGFFTHALNGTTARNAEELNQEAGAVLRRISKQAFGKRPPAETAINLWGWSEDQQQFVGYLYEGAADFEPVPRPLGGVGIRPSMDLGDLPSPDSMDAWLEIVRIIKAQDQAACLRGEKSCRIGGHLLEHRMYLNEATGRPETTVRRVSLFEDYEADLASAERHGIGSLQTLAGMLGAKPPPPLSPLLLANVGLQARRRR